MLREEQTAELLRRCELTVGHRLEAVRGNLRKSETRSAAIWELIVLEEASRIGRVEYEPEEGASPDIRLTLNSGTKIWIEVAFLYPRFWKEERKSREVTEWITKEAIRRGISPFRVECRFNGDITNKAGPVRSLPELHQKKQFLSDDDVSHFFANIERAPNSSFQTKHSSYSVDFIYTPSRIGPYVISGGGSVQEAPKEVKQHALYRVLRQKAKQHNVSGVRLVCVGSDQSPALLSGTSPWKLNVNEIVYEAFRTTSSLSGAIVLRIENEMTGWQTEQIARGEIYINHAAKVPIEDSDTDAISRMNFNRWKYFFRLEKSEPEMKNIYKRVGGNLVMSTRNDIVVFEVPANFVIDSLAGKTCLKEEYGYEKEHPMIRCFNDGWVVRACSYKNGDIEKGEAPKVILELGPPPEAVYWPEN